MIILGIESSCDETACAIVEDGTKILANITATSAGIHAKTGGVIPEDAARKQVQSIIPVIDLALKESGLTKDDIDAIAFTAGPGLIGSLLVGVETAKTLAYLWHKPLIPVNHLVGHLYANWFQSIPKFPALGLVVSGGHTDLVLIKGHGKMEYIGGTRDDAAGEAFDKTARLLGLPYPGGPNLSKSAQIYLDQNPNSVLTLFPRPLSDDDSFEWSFSGLKTAVLKYIRDLMGDTANLKLSDYKVISETPKVIKEKNRIAAEVQEAIVDSLVSKCVKAILKFEPASFLLAGGVAANSRLRSKFESELTSNNIKAVFHVPEPGLCTDNATYIASCAFFNNKTKEVADIDANPELTITDQV